MAKKKQLKLTHKQLFESKKFKDKYQQDLAKVVLGDKQYTVDEATKILDRYFNK